MTGWRLRVSQAHTALFLLLWLTGAAAFASFGLGWRDGVPEPTPEKHWPLTNHGHTLYVDPVWGRAFSILLPAFPLGFLAWLVLAGVMWFGFGIPVFGEEPAKPPADLDVVRARALHAELRRRRRKTLSCFLGYFAWFILMAPLSEWLGAWVVLPIFAGLVTAGYFSSKWWICPACGAALGRDVAPARCGSCGEWLRG